MRFEIHIGRQYGDSTSRSEDERLDRLDTWLCRQTRTFNPYDLTWDELDSLREGVARILEVDTSRIMLRAPHDRIIVGLYR